MKEREKNIVTILQTRRGSSRLKDKVLMPLMGKPLFVRQAERVMAAKLCGTVVIATTTKKEDDFIEKICAVEGLECFRGSDADLLDRHYQAAIDYGADIVIKIPSDCPLIDPKVIDKVIQFYLDNEAQYDYVSNLHPATYPDGNDVEVMSCDALETAWAEASSQMEREHTTPYIWERPQQFRIGNVEMNEGLNYSMSHRWTIDYLEDYRFIETVYNELYETDPLFSFQDILSLTAQRPDIFSINKHHAGVNWYRHHLHELTTVDASQTKQATS